MCRSLGVSTAACVFTHHTYHMNADQLEGQSEHMITTPFIRAITFTTIALCPEFLSFWVLTQIVLHVNGYGP